MCHVIQTFFGSSLGKVFILVGYVWQILGRGPFYLPRLPHPWAAPKKPILTRIKAVLKHLWKAFDFISPNFLIDKWNALKLSSTVLHCMKSVQIRSYSWSVISCIQTEYGPEITLHLDTFHAVLKLVYNYLQDWKQRRKTAFFFWKKLLRLKYVIRFICTY